MKRPFCVPGPTPDHSDPGSCPIFPNKSNIVPPSNKATASSPLNDNEPVEKSSELVKLDEAEVLHTTKTSHDANVTFGKLIFEDAEVFPFEKILIE